MVVDSTIFIEFLRSKNKEKTVLYSIPDKVKLFVSSVTLYELLIGATTPEKVEDIKLLTEDLDIIPFDGQIAKKASEIYHQLRKKNKMIEFRDIFIAATCLKFDLSIKTLNVKHFERIENLRIE